MDKLNKWVKRVFYALVFAYLIRYTFFPPAPAVHQSSFDRVLQDILLVIVIIFMLIAGYSFFNLERDRKRWIKEDKN